MELGANDRVGVCWVKMTWMEKEDMGATGTVEGTWLGLDVIRKGQYDAKKWNLSNWKSDGKINRKKERQNMRYHAGEKLMKLSNKR